MLKQITSRKLRPSELLRFWQVRYYDFPVWSEAKRIEKLRYIHRNPVRRGLVERPEDWEWSSFLQWATGAEAGSRSSVRPPRGGEKERNCCRRSWQPTLPHKTREGRGNRIQSRDCVEWASPPLCRRSRHTCFQQPHLETQTDQVRSNNEKHQVLIADYHA